MDKNNLQNDAAYEVASMKSSARYWFKRDFCDIRHGKDRSILIALEKAGWSGDNGLGQLPWNIRVEDKRSFQAWKLGILSINGEDKLVFERFLRGISGVKTDTFNLSYLPNWIIEELEQVALEITQRDFEKEAGEFVEKIARQAKEEKQSQKATLSAKVEELSIGGLFHIMSQTRGDERGSFREVARMPEIELLTGYDFVGKQVNHSMSTYGILRGMHVEPWAKLVTVIHGFAVSVLLDCRLHSRTYGKMETIFLGYGKAPDGEEVKGGALFIEPGIANSVLVLSEKMDYQYVVDDLWRPETALYSVNPMDSELAIDWGKYVSLDKITRSERDTKSPTFAEFTKLMKENGK